MHEALYNVEYKKNSDRENYWLQMAIYRQSRAPAHQLTQKEEEVECWYQRKNM